MSLDFIPEAEYFGEPGLKFQGNSEYNTSNIAPIGTPLDPGNFISGLTASLVSLAEFKKIIGLCVIAVTRGRRVDDENFIIYHPICELLGLKPAGYKEALRVSQLSIYS